MSRTDSRRIKPKEGERRQVPPDDLIPADYNPRSITPSSMAKLKASIREFGMVQDILVNIRTGNVVGGHQRIEAARQLAIATVPVTYVDLDPDREKALNIVLNNTEVGGFFDRPKMALVLQDLQKDETLLELTGLSLSEISRTLEELKAAADPVYPLVPRFLESYDYVVIITNNVTDWTKLKSMLGLRKEKSYKSKAIGEGRVLEFSRFEELWENRRGR